MVDSTCVVCGGRVSSTRSRKYCSRSCQARACYERQKATDHRSRPNVAATRKTWMDANRYRYKDRERAAQRRRYAETECSSERVRMARQKLRTAARGTSARSVWTAGLCRRCGELFVGHGTGSSAVLAYCSGRCAQRDKSNLRRALRAGVKLTKGRRYKVLERDGWCCRICGDPVNRNAVVPALDAPVIDHRIPLAAGGAHEEANWQTAHFYCNSVKRDQVGFDFAA